MLIFNFYSDLVGKSLVSIDEIWHLNILAFNFKVKWKSKISCRMSVVFRPKKKMKKIQTKKVDGPFYVLKKAYSIFPPNEES